MMKVAYSATKKYSPHLTKEEIESCVMIATMFASERYDPEMQTKFTTYLYNGVRLQCIEAIRKNKNKIHGLTCKWMHSNIPTKDTNELLREIEDEIKIIPDGDMLYDKVILGYSIKEIAKKRKKSYESVRRKVNNAQKILQRNMKVGV